MTEDTGRDENVGGGESAAAIDFGQFDSMIDGPESPCVAIYLDFVAGTPEKLRGIHDAAERGEREKAEAAAHQLKGASASLGLAGFSARMAETERVARDGGDLETIAAGAWLEGVGSLFEATVARVRAERGIGA